MNKSFSIETLVEELKLVVTLEVDFKYGDKSNSVASFGVLDYPSFKPMNKNTWSFKEYPCTCLGLSIETFIEEIKSVNTAKKCLRVGMNQFRKHFTFCNIETTRNLNQGATYSFFESKFPLQV